MKKTLLLIPIFAIVLMIPLVSAGSYNMNVSGSGDIGFYFKSSDDYGKIIQGYKGDGSVEYKSSYSDGLLKTKIDSSGDGAFGTVLNPEDTWRARASYEDDGDTVYDYGVGYNKKIFRHKWSDSFVGSGMYKIE